MLKGVSEAEGLEGWVQSKITKAASDIGSVYHHLDYQEAEVKMPGIAENEDPEMKSAHDAGYRDASRGKKKNPHNPGSPLAKQYDQRLTFHPGPFNVLASESQSAVAKTVKELNQHSQIFDLMGLECSHYYPVNIHIGGTYGCKQDAVARFCENFKKLSDSAKSRLVIENDDRASMYSVKDLYDVSICTGAPITFDYHHHRLNTGGLSEEDALKLAASTWPVKQLVHYSSCKKTHEDPTAKPQAHADMIYEKIKTYGLSLDIEIEAKAKELAVIKYLDQVKKDTLLKEYIEF
jgi:UV DNA damage endonuclease